MTVKGPKFQTATASAININKIFFCSKFCIFHFFVVNLRRKVFEKDMANEAIIKLFEDKKIRIVWNEEQEKYYFSVVDIVQVLTDSADGRTYWKVLKNRLIKEGNQTVTNCNQLKLLAADGKQRMTDVADLEGIFRLIQSIPSKKAEPVKRWLAEVGAQRIDQMIDPELTFQMTVEDYRRQGYSGKWPRMRGRIWNASWDAVSFLPNVHPITSVR